MAKLFKVGYIVATMSFYTPLRYPGGKRRLVAFVGRLLEVNQLWNIQYVEPCAGGASIALALLYGEYASSIYINDLSRPVFAFWHTALNDAEELCNRIERTAVTTDEWHRQRAVYENSDAADLFDLGFAAFFLNRTNRSGIIGGGVIGGKDQTGRWKLDCRFTKDDLIPRIKRIRRYRNRIHLFRQEALDFTDDVVAGLHGNVLAFYDPPYIEKGQGLYLDNYDLEDHRKLANRVGRLDQPWIVTYDYDAAVRSELFRGNRRLSFELSYSAQHRRHGREAMFFADRLYLPDERKTEEAIVSMSAAKSEYPVFGRLEQWTKSQHLETNGCSYRD